MSIDPRRGGVYSYEPTLEEQYPYDDIPRTIPTEELPVAPRQAASRSEYDNPEQRYVTVDPRGQILYDPEEWGDVGPMHGTPEALQWIKENVTDKDYVVWWDTDRAIIDEQGNVVGHVPKYFPRMT